MAVSDKILSSDLIADDVFVKVTGNAAAATIAVTNLVAGLKGVILANADLLKQAPTDKNAAQIKAETALIDQSVKARKGLIEVEKVAEGLKREKLKTAKAELKVTQDAQKELAKQAKELAKLNSEYSQGVKRLSDIKKELKELNFTGKESTARFKELTAEFKDLDSKVRKAEESAGEFQRNVGNYPKTLKELKVALKDAKNEMVAVAAASGMDSKEFAEAAAKAGKLKDQLNDINTAANQMATGGGLGVFKNQLKGVGESLMELDFKEAAERAKALGVTAKALKFSELISGAKSAAVALWQMAAAFLATPLGIIVAIGAAIAGIAYAVYSYTESLKDNTEAVKLNKAAIDDLKQTNKELRIEIEASNNAIAVSEGKMTSVVEKKLLAHAKFEKSMDDARKKRAELRDAMKAELDKDDSIFKTEEQKAAELARHLAKFDKEANEQRKNNAILLKNDLAAIDIEAKAEAKEKQDKANEKAAEDLKKANAKLLSDAKALRDLETANITNEQARARAERTIAFNDWFAENKHNAAAVIEAGILLDKDLKAIDKDFKDKEKEAQTKHNEAMYKSQEDLAKLLEDLKKKQADFNKKEFDKEKAKIVKDAEANIAAEIKAVQDKISFAQQITTALQQELDKREQMQMKQLDRVIANDQKSIDRQFQLAKEGKANQLAFEEQELAKNQLKKRDAEEKAARQKEAIQLAQAYMAAYTAEAAIDPTAQAPLRALKSVLLAKGIAKGIAQFAAEGNDDVQGAGTTTSDSIPFMLSKHEGVVKADANMNNPGVVSALNKGIFEQMFIPKNEIQGRGFAENVANSLLIQQNSEITKLLKDIANKPIQQVDVDGFGNLIETIYTRGRKDTIVHKQRTRI